MCDRLNKFLKNNCLSRDWLAKNIGVNYNTVTRYILGVRIPEKETMQKIYQVTRGHIRPDHFYDLPVIEKNLSSSGTGGECEVVRSAMCLGDNDIKPSVPSSQNIACAQSYRLPQDVPLLPEVFQA